MVVVFAVIGLPAAVFAGIQLVPYGHDHTNPRGSGPFRWSSPQAAVIAKRSCYDCHSDETRWWWAIDIAPFSWLAQRDITEGRDWLNFSGWTATLGADQLERALKHGMPPWQYTVVHPSARLTTAERRTLVAGFQASLADQRMPSPLLRAAVPTAIVRTACASCHSAATALDYRASRAQAEAMLKEMIQQGALLSAGQEQTLIAYYTR